MGRSIETMSVDIAKLLGISARVAGAITIACVFLLFFPASILPFDIIEHRVTYGFWLFIFLVVSFAICISHIIRWFIDKVRNKIETRKMWDSYRYILENLSRDEKDFLKEYYEKRETAIYINLTNPVHTKLRTFQVISIATGTSFGTMHKVPGFIQPWVFDLIDEDNKYIL